MAHLSKILDGTVRYAGLPLAPAEGLGRGIFCPLGKKKLFTLFVLILGLVWCSVVTSIKFSRNLSNFENNPKNSKEIKRIQKLKNKKIKNIKNNFKNPKKKKNYKEIKKKIKKFN